MYTVCFRDGNDDISEETEEKKTSGISLPTFGGIPTPAAPVSLPSPFPADLPKFPVVATSLPGTGKFFMNNQK